MKNSPWVRRKRLVAAAIAINAGRAQAIYEPYAIGTFAGMEGTAGSFDGVGAPPPLFAHPGGVAVDSAGNSYVADTNNHVIRKVAPDGSVSTLAGLEGVSGSADGIGSAARFDLPNGVAVDAAGNVYVADTNNSTIRKITPGSTVTTFAGLAGEAGGDDGSGSAARFVSPCGWR